MGAFQDVAFHAAVREGLLDEDDTSVDADALANDALEYVAEEVAVHASDARAWAGVHTLDVADDDVVAAVTFRPCLLDQDGVPYDADQVENLEVVVPSSDHGDIPGQT